MKEPKEQAKIISDFLTSLVSDCTVPMNIISMTTKNGEKTQKEFYKDEFFQLDILTLTLLNASDLETEYTLLYVPIPDKNKIYVGFLEPQKEYLTWEFSLDDNTLKVSGMDLVELLLLRPLEGSFIY